MRAVTATVTITVTSYSLTQIFIFVNGLFVFLLNDEIGPVTAGAISWQFCTLAGYISIKYVGATH